METDAMSKTPILENKPVLSQSQIFGGLDWIEYLHRTQLLEEMYPV